MTTTKRSEAAKKTIESLIDNPNQSFVIHYARQNLMDNESGVATPRIIAILVKSLDGNRNECFAIHHEAEKANIIRENIVDHYDFLEERLLRGFNAFVKNNRNCRWINWDMNGVHFSFEAIKHRYMVMISEAEQDFQEIAHQNRVNLNSLLKEIYGNNYVAEPVFESLMKCNNGGVCKRDFLTLEAEARAFTNLEFPAILESLICKVDFVSEVLGKTSDGSLEIANTKKSKQNSANSDESALANLLRNGLFWSIVVPVGGIAFGLGIYFGEAKFDKDKIDWYNENRILKDSTGLLRKDNNTLKYENDSLKLLVPDTSSTLK